MPNRAVVLLSGGLDSSTVMAMAVADGYDTYAISFDYHQRHSIELEAARAVAVSLGAAKHLVVSFDLREIGGSALTADISVPKQAAGTPGQENSDMNPLMRVPVTYVPARNTIFLSFALAWAEVLQAPHIFIGANVMDYSGYPDCRPEYLSSYEHMANLATKTTLDGTFRFSIKAPLLSMTKADIIARGSALGLDYGLTWSCYDPQPPGESFRALPGTAFGGYTPCGECDSCRFRIKGFAEAGLKDPGSLHVL
ncbi:MAG: 7-cyano-7-deazaguanine synthase QueC [Thermodesulfovibrio sp.]|nr:7-cyano-7-deazaguanine synthase QueC [Thermodesulfovibrio sp.]